VHGREQVVALFSLSRRRPYFPVRGDGGKVRKRRAAVAAEHPGDCLLSDPAADPPGRRLSRQPMPRSSRSSRQPRRASMPAAALPWRLRSLTNFGLRLNRRPPGGGNPAWSDQMRSITEASVAVASKGSRLDHAICDHRHGTRHQNSHGQSRSVRTPNARSQGDQSRRVGSLDGKSHRGTRSSNIGQIRRKPRQAIPSPMGYPNPSPLNDTGHTRNNTPENNKDSLASERGCLPTS